MARPSDLTPDLQEKIINVLSSGVPIRDACSFVGISEGTYYKWTQRGAKARKGDEKYIEFLHAATRARVQGRVGAVAVIRKSIQGGNSDDARWFLERSDPANWGRKDVLLTLGIDPALLKELKKIADSKNIPLSDVFEAMLQELANVDSTRDSEE